MIMYNSPVVLDKKDILILKELDNNSRQSFTEIGKKVGLRSYTVEYRINKLRQAGVILKFFAEPNLTYLGLKTYRLYLRVEHTTEKDETALLHYFSTNPRIQWHAEFEGEWDYTIRYALKDEVELKYEIEKLTKQFGEFIKAKTIAISTYQVYLPITYLTGAERKSLRETIRPSKLDPIDITILSFLCDDARMSSVAIAQRSLLSPDAVSYRIKRMVQNKTIISFNAWFDRRKLGYEYYKILFWFSHATPSDEEKIIKFCQHYQYVVFINKVLGSWDLEVDLDATNSNQVHEFIKEIKRIFPHLIRDHSTLTILRDSVVNPFKAALLVNQRV